MTDTSKTNPVEEITALINQIKNAGPLIKAVNKIALDEDNLAAWDCLIALDKAAQEMIDEQIYEDDPGSWHDCHTYSIQQHAKKESSV